jgi:hypothetical protein
VLTLVFIAERPQHIVWRNAMVLTFAWGPALRLYFFFVRADHRTPQATDAWSKCRSGAGYSNRSSAPASYHGSLVDFERNSNDCLADYSRCYCRRDSCARCHRYFFSYERRRKALTFRYRSCHTSSSANDRVLLLLGNSYAPCSWRLAFFHRRAWLSIFIGHARPYR